MVLHSWNSVFLMMEKMANAVVLISIVFQIQNSCFHWSDTIWHSLVAQHYIFAHFFCCREAEMGLRQHRCTYKLGETSQCTDHALPYTNHCVNRILAVSSYVNFLSCGEKRWLHCQKFVNYSTVVPLIPDSSQLEIRKQHRKIWPLCFVVVGPCFKTITPTFVRRGVSAPYFITSHLPASAQRHPHVMHG